jgi:hypothetical protein
MATSSPNDLIDSGSAPRVHRCVVVGDVRSVD